MSTRRGFLMTMEKYVGMDYRSLTCYMAVYKHRCTYIIYQEQPHQQSCTRVLPCSYLTSHHSKKHIGQQNYKKLCIPLHNRFSISQLTGKLFNQRNSCIEQVKLVLIVYFCMQKTITLPRNETNSTISHSAHDHPLLQGIR